MSIPLEVSSRLSTCVICDTPLTPDQDRTCSVRCARQDVRMAYAARNLEIRELRQQNLSLRDIGSRYGLSQQRVTQILGKTGRRAESPPAPTRACVTCGKEHSNLKYCSIACRPKHTASSACKTCGKTFTFNLSRRPNPPFCSRECWKIGWKAFEETRACAVCGNTFTVHSNNRNQKTCSRICARRLEAKS